MFWTFQTIRASYIMYSNRRLRYVVNTHCYASCLTLTTTATSYARVWRVQRTEYCVVIFNTASEFQNATLYVIAYIINPERISENVIVDPNVWIKYMYTFVIYRCSIMLYNEFWKTIKYGLNNSFVLLFFLLFSTFSQT